jgi:CheY-like chemotaxis protein
VPAWSAAGGITMKTNMSLALVVAGDTSGYEVARTVCARGYGAVRLVALTGYAQPEDVRRAKDAGFDAHLAKPPDPDELARALW